ncbi:hypothetical protein DFH09DRAFT_1342440 [Mycena vulgaris]|nr:hypothetical protein DFH09DRAFT_1342440 [Mycena vulgaris]
MRHRHLIVTWWSESAESFHPKSVLTTTADVTSSLPILELFAELQPALIHIGARALESAATLLVFLQAKMSLHSYHTASRGSRPLRWPTRPLQWHISPPTSTSFLRLLLFPSYSSPGIPVYLKVGPDKGYCRPWTIPTPTLSPLFLPQLSDVVRLQIRLLRPLHSRSCPTLGETHHVPACDRIQHKIDIDEYTKNQNPPVPELEDVNDDIDLADAFMELGVADGESSVNNLVNVLTGLVITNDGPDVRGQHHSKLFSSRDDFQSSLPDVPLAFQPPSDEEAVSSIKALVAAAAAAPAADPPPMRTQGPTRYERRESTLTVMQGRIRTAHTALDHVYTLLRTNSDHYSARLALDATAQTVVAADRLLRSVKAAKNYKELAVLWDKVWAEAVALDQLVDAVGAIVQEVYVEQVDEVQYDTAHHFEDPIKDHDTVAQLVILLAIISNVVIGLATNPCNFLIDTVTMIIKATMNMSSPAGHTTKQRDVLSQLPTTLEDVLKTFKLEPKTRILATCGSL